MALANAYKHNETFMYIGYVGFQGFRFNVETLNTTLAREFVSTPALIVVLQQCINTLSHLVLQRCYKPYNAVTTRLQYEYMMGQRQERNYN